MTLNPSMLGGGEEPMHAQEMRSLARGSRIGKRSVQGHDIRQNKGRAHYSSIGRGAMVAPIGKIETSAPIQPVTFFRRQKTAKINEDRRGGDVLEAARPPPAGSPLEPLLAARTAPRQQVCDEPGLHFA